MRWRLERVLGYRFTADLDVVNERGAHLYHMIFATDHDAGTRIMTALYRKAAGDFPQMRRQARATARAGGAGAGDPAASRHGRP
jgi:hypothetical protein